MMGQKLINDPLEFELLADAYFQECLTPIPPRPLTLPGLAYALGFSGTRTLLHYRNDDTHEEFHDVANRACLRVEQFTAEQLFNKGVNVAGPVFSLKNQGWRDKPEGESETIIVRIEGAAARL